MRCDIKGIYHKQQYQDAYFRLRDLLENDVLDLLQDYKSRHWIMPCTDSDRPRGRTHEITDQVRQMAQEERKAWIVATQMLDDYFSPAYQLYIAKTLEGRTQ